MVVLSIMVPVYEDCGRLQHFAHSLIIVAN